MIVDRNLMIEHGQKMSTQIGELRHSGILAPERAGQLAATTFGMDSTDERIFSDGEGFQVYGVRMLESVGE